MKLTRKTAITFALATVVATTAACDSSPSTADDMSRIQVLITDSPDEYLSTAFVEISRVYLIPGEEDPEEGPPFVDLFNASDDGVEPLWVDLLTLQDGVVEDVTGEVELPAGRYRQLRMIVSRAEVTLNEEYEFADGGQTRDLVVPSGAQTGIKAMLDEPIDTEGGMVSVILLDFDVNENFVIQGDPNTPAGIQGVLFTPVLRELARNTNP